MPYRDPAERAAHAKAYYEDRKVEIAVKKKAHYEANKVEILADKKVYGKSHKVEIAARKKVAYKANKVEILADKKAYYATLRASIIIRLGGCCVRCDAVEDLECDHVNDNGDEHRKSFGCQNRISATYRWMLNAPLEEVLYGTYAIQLLCNECHRTKDKWSTTPDLFFDNSKKAA